MPKVILKLSFVSEARPRPGRQFVTENINYREKQAMTPGLEVVDVPVHESFKAWGHGYPYCTVRWHFHPEYEIQLITETEQLSFESACVNRVVASGQAAA